MRSNIERERRFLVADRSIVNGHGGNLIVQAYLFAAEGYAVRVRRTHWPNDDGSFHEGPAIFALKGPRKNAARSEYETEITIEDATELIKLAPYKLSKTRYQLIDSKHVWDVDVFHGDNEGLVISECETDNVARILVPSWCGAEVTDDARYNNENLAMHPFRSWTA
jgi:adenylate cyclase